MPTPFTTIQTVYLITSWLNLALYTVEWALYGVYLYKFTRDRKVRRWVVFTALLNDAISTAVLCTRAYLVLALQHMHEFERIWPVPFIILTNTISSGIEHVFLICRIYQLHTFNGPALIMSPKSVIRRLWPVILLSFLTVLHLIFSTMSAIFVALRSNSSSGFGFIASVIARSLRALLDVLIACFLVYRLKQFETSFVATQSFIHRFIIRVLATGIFAAVIMVVIIALMFVDDIALVASTSIVGRVYTITLLAHLCSREPIHDDVVVNNPHPQPVPRVLVLRSTRK